MIKELTIAEPLMLRLLSLWIATADAEASGYQFALKEVKWPFCVYIEIAISIVLAILMCIGLGDKCVDSTGNISFANSSFLDYTQEELVGSNLFDLVEEGSYVYNTMKHRFTSVFDQKVIWQADICFEHSKGQRRTHDLLSLDDDQINDMFSENTISIFNFKIVPITGMNGESREAIVSLLKQSLCRERETAKLLAIAKGKENLVA